MNATDSLGLFAAGLLAASFYARTMTSMRLLAIAGCLAFIAYAAYAGSWPVFALFYVLLPINVFRLWQSNQLMHQMKDASPLGLRLDRIIQGMRRVIARRGYVLFSKGDNAKIVYYILSGSITLVDHGTVMRAGEILGEMAMFTPNGRRTDTAICSTDVELAAIDEASVWRTLQESPEFGLYLIRRLVERSNGGSGMRAAHEGGVASLVA